MINLAFCFLQIFNFLFQCEFHYKAGREMPPSFELQKQPAPNEEEWYLDTMMVFAKATRTHLFI